MFMVSCDCLSWECWLPRCTILPSNCASSCGKSHSESAVSHVGCLVHVHALASDWCHLESSHSTVTTLGVLKQPYKRRLWIQQKKMMSFLSLTFRSVPLGQKWLRNWNSKCKDLLDPVLPTRHFQTKNDGEIMVLWSMLYICCGLLG